MILEAYYQGRRVLLDVGNGFVFDGAAFVDPSNAKYVELSVAGTATAPPETYPIMDEGPTPPTETLTNYWICKVIGVHSNSAIANGGDVITAPDPTNGAGCICGITCMGTAVQNVNVVYAS